MSEWISVKDKLPPKDGKIVLAFCNSDEDGLILSPAIIKKGKWYYSDNEVESLYTDLEDQYKSYENIWLENIPTHWMPLPEPPTS